MPSRPCPRPTHRFCPGIHWPQAQARAQGQSPGLRFSHWSILGIHPTGPPPPPHSSGLGHGHWFEHKLWPLAPRGQNAGHGRWFRHMLWHWPKARASAMAKGPSHSQLRHWPRICMSAGMIPLSGACACVRACMCPICFRPRVCYSVLLGFVGHTRPSRTA
jgi:hypothetical protein